MIVAIIWTQCSFLCNIKQRYDIINIQVSSIWKVGGEGGRYSYPIVLSTEVLFPIFVERNGVKQFHINLL